MDGPEGIQLSTAIGATDRGTLWRATPYREHDRIVRIVEARFWDRRFKNALTRLRSRRYPRMLEIVGDGCSGAHYYIEYAVDPPWQTLEEHLNALGHWQDRIAVAGQVCEVLGQWRTSPVQPLGLSVRNIVMTRNAGRWFPWLLPCPAITISSPCDLFGLDAPVMAALAPELIRNVSLDKRAQDVYALGTLAAQAAGCPPSRRADAENRVEAQARGVLLAPDATRSRIQPFLHASPAVQQLFLTIRRYRHTAADARPTDASELASVVAALTDSIALAKTFLPTDPRRALEVLSWVKDSDPGFLDSLDLAATISIEIGKRAQALRHLDRAVSIAPHRQDIRRRRCDLRWQVYVDLPPGERATREGDLLLEDLAKIVQHDSKESTTPYIRAAQVYSDRGELAAAARELYEAAQSNRGDLHVLLKYGQCLVDMGLSDDATAVAQAAHRRIEGMVQAGVITEEVGQQWDEQFNDLLD